MLDIKKLGAFKETSPTVDYIHVENKFGPQGKGSVRQGMRVANTLSDDRKILWVSLSMNVNITSESDETKPLLESEIRTHVGYVFQEPQDASMLNDSDIVSIFAIPLYQRTAEILLINLRAMGFEVNLPLAMPPREIIHKDLP